MPRDRSNEAWIQDLTAGGAVQEQALEDLRQIILSGLPYGLSKWITANDPRFEPLAGEVVQETLVRVLDRLDTFEGRSKFTTWVYTIAVRIALTELRKARWRETSLDEILEGNPNYFSTEVDGFHQHSENPEEALEKSDLMMRIERIIQEELTEKQRNALIALAVKDMPMEVVAEQLGTNRNALYKLLHDARLRLKQRMEAEGLMPEDVLASFED